MRALKACVEVGGQLVDSLSLYRNCNVVVHVWPQALSPTEPSCRPLPVFKHKIHLIYLELQRMLSFEDMPSSRQSHICGSLPRTLRRAGSRARKHVGDSASLPDPPLSTVIGGPSGPIVFPRLFLQ